MARRRDDSETAAVEIEIVAAVAVGRPGAWRWYRQPGGSTGAIGQRRLHADLLLPLH